ncbi:hypothetical protein A2U01_0091318, partial [Trifolium medium]|nr:hypothetical protein [Trifolium medium]
GTLDKSSDGGTEKALVTPPLCVATSRWQNKDWVGKERLF